MKSLSRQTLAEQAEEQIAVAILSGELSGKLPGHRELCRVFGISRTSLEPALAALVARGLLVSRGPRRRFEVAESPPRVRVMPTATRRALVLEPTLAGLPTPVARRVVDALRARLQGGAWQLQEHYLAVDQSRKNARRFSAILNAEQPDLVIVVGGHAHTIEWFRQRGVPFLCFGGDTKGPPVTAVNYDADSMTHDALRHHLQAGCRDPFIPLRVRTPGFVERVRGAVAQELEAAGIRFSAEWHTPILRENNPDALHEVVDRRFQRRVPDAWLCFGHDMLIAAMGIAACRGMRMPHEVALTLLGPRQDLPWLPPWIGGFDFPIAPVASLLAKWLHQGEQMRDVGITRIRPVWQPGESPSAG